MDRFGAIKLRPNEFELFVLHETASHMSGKNKLNLLKQIDSIKTVLGDPFKTCFTFLFHKIVDTESVRIDDRPGLILSRVSGNMTGVLCRHMFTILYSSKV